MQPTILSIALDQLDFNNNSREDWGDITSLTESIATIGLIQPIVLHLEEDGKYKVAAGRRRLKALQQLGYLEVYEGLTCTVGSPGFVFREKMTEDQLLEVELEENLQRKGLTWTEEVMMIHRVHEAKSRNAFLDGQSWGQRQTGQLLGVSLGQVNGVLNVAKLLKAGDKDIVNAGSLVDAYKVLMERKENAAQKILAQKAGVTFEPADITKTPAPDLSVPIPADSPLRLDLSAPDGKGMDVIAPKDRMTVRIGNHLFLGDSIDDILPRWPDACMDHIVTDIPYGIDMDNMTDLRGMNRVVDEHDVAENVGLMPRFLKQAYRLIKDGGFCVFFYDLDHHEKLQGWAIAEGFKVQRWPLMWVKTHRCKNDAAAFNYTKAVEVAMVLRKGNATLTKPQPVNYILADGSVERKLYDNPFAKPFVVWKFIYDAIAIPGQKVLDPFAGEMSAVRAAVISGLMPFAVELKEEHYNRGISHFKEAYRLLTTGNVDFE